MEQSYTYNFLLKYLYRETNLCRTLEIENELINDKSLSKRYQRLLNGFKLLPKVKFYPTDKTISEVLNYSQKTQLNPSF